MKQLELTEISAFTGSVIEPVSYLSDKIAEYADPFGFRPYLGLETEQYHDEYLEHSTELTPLNTKSLYNLQTKDLQEFFDYISNTSDIEWESDRTDTLNNQVKKMAQKAHDLGYAEELVDARVVILNKGVMPSAFATEDGTIFISQSLINLCDSEDELSGILAHELGHLINKTSYSASKVNDIDRFGVRWIHEIASDLLSPPLLEAMQLNSSALRLVLNKLNKLIPDSKRVLGDVHLGELTREVLDIGQHALMDHTTATQELKDINDMHPDLSSKKPITPTHSEIVMTAYEIADTNTLQNILPRLSNQDYSNLRNNLGKEANELGRSLSPQMEDSDRKFVSKYMTLFASIYDLEIKRAVEEEGLSYTAALAKTIRSTHPNAKELSMLDYLRPAERIMEIWEEYLNLKWDATTFHNHIETYLTVEEDSSDGIFLEEEDLIKIITDEEQLDGQLAIYLSPTRITMQYCYLMLLNDKFTEEQVSNFIQKVISRGVSLSEVSIEKFFPKKYLSLHYPDRIDHEKLRKIKDIAQSLLPEKQEVAVTYNPTMELNTFFGSIEETQSRLFHERDFSRLSELCFAIISKLRAEYRENTINEEQVQNLMQITFDTLQNKIDVMNLDVSSSTNIIDNLNNILGKGKLVTMMDLQADSHPNTEVNKMVNEALVKFQLKTFVAGLFHQDNDSYYEYIQAEMDLIEEYTGGLTREGMLNLCQNILAATASDTTMSIYALSGTDYRDWFKPRSIYSRFPSRSNTEKTEELSFIKRIITTETSLELENSTLQEILRISQIINNKYLAGYSPQSTIFNAKFINMLWCEPIREAILDKLKQVDTLDLQTYPQLKDLLEKILPNKSAQKERYLRNIDLAYLSTTVDKIELIEKAEYLAENFSRIGVEGLIILGDQVATLGEYEAIRPILEKEIVKFLKGNTSTTMTAFADAISEEFIKDNEKLFDTMNASEENSKEKTIAMLRTWFSLYTKGTTDVRVSNEDDFSKFTAESPTTIFRSFRDTIETFTESGAGIRQAVTLKALTGNDGAMTTRENREKLAKRLIEVLNIGEENIEEIIRIAITEGDAAVLSQPAVLLIAPLLFSSFDTNILDDNEVASIQTHFQNLEDLWNTPEKRKQLLNARTEDMIIFGDQKEPYPTDSYARASTLTLQKDYQEFSQFFNGIDTKINNKSSQIDYPSTGKLPKQQEAMIRAFESGGPVPVRILQLISQLIYIENPLLRARIQKAIDSQDRISRIQFWENAHKDLYQREDVDPKLKVLLEHVTIKGKAGEGSMASSWLATISPFNDQEDTGLIFEQPTDIVIKRSHPSTKLMIESASQLLNRIVEVLESRRSNNAQMLEYISILKTATKLTTEWCYKDFEDPTYKEDDDLFRQHFGVPYYLEDGMEIALPGRIDIDDPRYKFEHEAKGGQTVNRILLKNELSVEVQREITKKYAAFYKKQLYQSPIDKGGKRFRIIHSDPSAGNYMVKVSPEGKVERLYMIDRDMYLKVPEEKMPTYLMLAEGKWGKFAEGIVDIALEEKGTNNVGRLMAKAAVKAKLFFQGFDKKFEQASDTSAEDTINEFLAQLQKFNGIELSLETRRIIISILMFHRQLNKFGLNFNELPES